MKNEVEMVNVVFRIPRDRGASKEKIVRTSVTKAMYDQETAKPKHKRVGNWQFVELDKPDEEIDLGLDTETLEVDNVNLIPADEETKSVVDQAIDNGDSVTIEVSKRGRKKTKDIE